MEERPHLIALPYLARWRAHRRWTQLDLAKKALVGHTTIARAEIGEPVRWLTAERLARALKVTVTQLRVEEPR